MTPSVALVAAYVLGSVPFSLLASRLKGIDIREHGSGNLGATNAIRVLGPGLGVPVLLADIAKGLVAVTVIPDLFGATGTLIPLACGAAAILGHVTSIFLKFRGGKGVATAAGAFFGLAPAALGLAALVFTATLLTSRFVSLASMLGAVTLPLALAFTGAPREILIAGAAITALVLFRHRTNVSRILSGTESKVSFDKRGGTS